MQHPFFDPLDDRELALLLTTLTVGGSDAAAIFAGLETAVATRLQDKTRALLAIPSDKRVPLMVRELRAVWEGQHQRGIERLDPSWIVHALHGESPRVAAALLVGLPASMVRSVLRRLPPAVRAELPPRGEVANLDPAVAAGIRHSFAARFAPMPARHGDGFAFADLIHLSRAELFALIRDLGLTELGQAFVSVGRQALLELCRRLPREHAEELVHAVKVASRVDLPDPKSAQRCLSRVVVNFANTEELLQKAGLWRLAKACSGEPPSARRVLAQRLPYRAAELLEGFLSKAQDMEGVDEAAQARLQDAILVRLVLLSRAGTLAELWQNMAMRYRDPQAAEAALAQPLPMADEPLEGQFAGIMDGPGPGSGE